MMIPDTSKTKLHLELNLNNSKLQSIFLSLPSSSAAISSIVQIPKCFTGKQKINMKPWNQVKKLL